MSVDKSNEKEFKQNHQQALIRVGLGIYIINELQKQEVIEDHNKEYHIRMWAKVLADGIDVPVASVVVDATALYKAFPNSFLSSTRTQQLMHALMPLMTEVGALPRYR